LAVGQRDQSRVGDGDAMGVTAEIVEHILGAAEGWLGVDYPVFAKQRSQPGGEEFGMREPRQIPGKVQLASPKGQLEGIDELAADTAFADRARLLIKRGYSPKVAVELVLHEMEFEQGNNRGPWRRRVPMPRIFLGEPAKASFEVSSIGDPNCGGLSRF
jgi:hypothetical protein